MIAVTSDETLCDKEGFVVFITNIIFSCSIITVIMGTLQKNNSIDDVSKKGQTIKYLLAMHISKMEMQKKPFNIYKIWQG